MKILINRSDAIGDLILTTPIAEALKRKYPGCIVSFVISKKCKDIAEACPFIDEYHILGDLKECENYYKAFNPDIFLHLGGNRKLCFMAFKHRTKFRGGLKSKLETFLFLNHGVRQHRSRVLMHECEYNLGVLKPLGIEAKASDYLPKLDFGKSCEAFSAFKKEVPEFQKLIFIHPGMTGHTLNWPSINYGKLILKIFESLGDKALFVISHTPSDMPYVEKMNEAFNGNEEIKKHLYYFNGMIKGLKHYSQILSHADLFVGPSTGNTHIANTLGVKTIGIYSPILVQTAKRWGPANMNIATVFAPKDTTGVNTDSHKRIDHHPCMEQILVDDVAKKALEYLND